MSVSQNGLPASNVDELNVNVESPVPDVLIRVPDAVGALVVVAEI